MRWFRCLCGWEGRGEVGNATKERMEWGASNVGRLDTDCTAARARLAVSGSMGFLVLSGLLAPLVFPASVRSRRGFFSCVYSYVLPFLSFNLFPFLLAALLGELYPPVHALIFGSTSSF